MHYIILHRDTPIPGASREIRGGDRVMKKFRVNPGLIHMDVMAVSHEDAVEAYFRTRDSGPLRRGQLIGLEVRPLDDWQDKRFFEAEDCVAISCSITGDRPWSVDTY
jgi:hypothetical protein